MATKYKGETAQQLFDRGYVGLSNKYRTVSRIDRKDWLEYMAGKLRRSTAQFYIRTNEGALTDSTGQWGSFYCSMYSDDKMEGIPQQVYNDLKALRREAWEVTYVEPPVLWHHPYDVEPAVGLKEFLATFPFFRRGGFKTGGFVSGGEAPPNEVTERWFFLPITEEQAEMLRWVLERIGGDPEKSARRHADALLEALVDLRVKQKPHQVKGVSFSFADDEAN